MSERITLTDVMRGIHKHDLINRLTPGCFTFLVGLILAANEIGFKNPIGMSTKQATSAGGGDSRQTVYTRRKALSKIRLDGKPLITCVPGNHARNTVATYTIDYNLLCCYNGTWSTSTDVMLKNNDSGITQALLKRDRSDYSGATILRSEERREEQSAASKDLATPDKSKPVWTAPVDTEEDWVLYITDIIKKPDQKYLKLTVQEKIKWLVANNDMALLSECYDAFQEVPIARVHNRYAFFMKIIEDRGGNV